MSINTLYIKTYIKYDVEAAFAILKGKIQSKSNRKFHNILRLIDYFPLFPPKYNLVRKNSITHDSVGDL